MLLGWVSEMGMKCIGLGQEKGDEMMMFGLDEEINV